MCRNIRVLHHFQPPTTPDEVRAAALQYVRKVSGLNKASPADHLAFDRAIDEITVATERLLKSLLPRGRGADSGNASVRRLARKRWTEEESHRSYAPDARRSDSHLVMKRGLLRGFPGRGGAERGLLQHPSNDHQDVGSRRGPPRRARPCRVCRPPTPPELPRTMSAKRTTAGPLFHVHRLRLARGSGRDPTISA